MKAFNQTVVLQNEQKQADWDTLVCSALQSKRIGHSKITDQVNTDPSKITLVQWGLKAWPHNACDKSHKHEAHATSSLFDAKPKKTLRWAQAPYTKQWTSQSSLGDQELVQARQMPDQGKLLPVALVRLSPSLYLVHFDTACGVESFSFTVNDEVVPVVSWEPQFRKFVGRDFSSATPILDLILALHESFSRK